MRVYGRVADEPVIRGDDEVVELLMRARALLIIAPNHAASVTLYNDITNYLEIRQNAICRDEE